MKLLCINNKTDNPADQHFLTEGNTYTFEEERFDENEETSAYVLKEVKETCACCGERMCFDKDLFIPIEEQDSEELIQAEEDNS